MDSSHALVIDHLNLATRLARGYGGRGVDVEDLEQVARLGLVKAAHHYDSAKGDFAPFAAATVRGELKRYFRDFGWAVRPPRRIQELRARIKADTQEPITSANTERLAQAYDVEVADIVDVATAGACYVLPSVNHEDGVREPGGVDPGLDRVDDRASVASLCRDLSTDDRRLLQWRFGDQLSQSQIGELIGVSQVQVSRRLSRLLERLRQRALVELPGAA